MLKLRASFGARRAAAGVLWSLATGLLRRFFPLQQRKRSGRTQSLSGGAGRLGGFPIPRQKLGNTPGWMIADAGQDIGNICLRVAAVELRAFDQRIERGGAMSAGIGAGEEVILATDRDAA